MQITLSKPFDSDATTLLLCFSGFATSPALFAHLACDIPMCNIAICHDYGDLPYVDSSSLAQQSYHTESSPRGTSTIPPILWELQELIDRHRYCILIGFSLGVCVASRVLRAINRNGVFRLSIAVNGTPLGIDARHGIHPRIYTHTLENFDVQEFARSFFGIDDGLEIMKHPILRKYNGDSSTLFGSMLECKNELQSLWRFCETWARYESNDHTTKNLHFTHAIIGSRDKIFYPAVMESTFALARRHYIDAPHYIFDRFNSWGEILEMCEPLEDGMSAQRFWLARDSYTDNAPIQASMRQKLIQILLASTKTREFHRIFEFGAGVGDFSTLLQEHLICKHFICNDINNHAGALQARLQAGTQIEIFDMRHIREQCIFLERFDLIASNACLQWLDARKILADVATMLADGGMLLVSSFGKRTCYEVRETMGIGLEYVELADLCGVLKELGLEIVYSESEIRNIECRDALGVFRHFRASGVNSVAHSALNKSMILSYQERFGGKITYEPIYILATKTH